ncbi:hypothetical protein V4C53_47850, partial [Paraburkholderia azotifigens]
PPAAGSRWPRAARHALALRRTSPAQGSRHLTHCRTGCRARGDLWRDLKQRISELVEGKQMLPVWIIDEAQNLPPEFFHDFPSF